MFDGDSLQEAVDEINRYNRRRLVIEDPAVANMRIAGTFRTTDLDSFLAALSALHVSAQRVDADTVRLVHRSSP